MNHLPDNVCRIIDQKIIYIIGCLTAVLILFQANFSFGKFQINMNLADVLAICGATIALLHKNNNVHFKIPHTLPFIILCSLVFVLALAIGWLKFGFTNFAFVNKFLGVCILFGYSAIGALFISIFRMEGLLLLAKIMIASMIVILSIKLLINIVHYSEIFGDKLIINPILSGYANNRNAFAIQLLSLLCLQYFVPNLKNIFVTSFFTACLFLTYSRSAMITYATLFGIWYFGRFVDRAYMRKVILYSCAIAIVIFIMEFLVHNIVIWLKSISAWLHNTPAPINIGMFDLVNFSPASSDPQRMYSIFEALKLWWDSPWFGIGLGGFVNHEMLKNQTFLVIHNSFIWILTEFGVIGGSVFAWYGLRIIAHFYHHAKKLNPMHWVPQDQILLGLTIIFILMGNAHEIFYQRIFWFLFGMCIVSFKPDTENERATNLQYSMQ